MSKIIEVYHAGVDEIKHPDTSHSRPHLDFGQGFYLTDIYDQAYNWALRQANKLEREPIINIYLLKKQELLKEDRIRTRIFKSYNEQWLDFIVANRMGGELWKEYDYIEGGVADDRIIDTVELYVTGFISRKEAISRLRYIKNNNQICITNQTLIDKYLTFKDSEIIDRL